MTDEPQLGYCNLCGVSEIDHELHTCMGCNQLMCVDHGIEAVEDGGKRLGCICLQCCEDMIRYGKWQAEFPPMSVGSDS